MPYPESLLNRHPGRPDGDGSSGAEKTPAQISFLKTLGYIAWHKDISCPDGLASRLATPQIAVLNKPVIEVPGIDVLQRIVVLAGPGIETHLNNPACLFYDNGKYSLEFGGFLTTKRGGCLEEIAIHNASSPKPKVISGDIGIVDQSGDFQRVETPGRIGQARNLAERNTLLAVTAKITSAERISLWPYVVEVEGDIDNLFDSRTDQLRLSAKETPKASPPEPPRRPEVRPVPTPITPPAPDKTPQGKFDWAKIKPARFIGGGEEHKRAD